MKRVAISQTLTVIFSKEDDSDFTEAEIEQLRCNVDYLPQHAASAGLFTQDAFEAVVDTYDQHTSMKEVANA